MNLVTTPIMLEEMTRLLTAFPSNRRDSAKLAEVYKSGLLGIDATALHAAVDQCIKFDNYFPKVARLREAANDYVKRNRAVFAPIIVEAWDTCGVCGAKAVEVSPDGRTHMDHDPRLHNVKYEED